MQKHSILAIQKAMENSRLSCSLLALLYNSEATGYDLTKKLRSVWVASHQQVYRELNALLKNGAVNVKLVPQTGKPDKKVYTLQQSCKEYLKVTPLTIHDPKFNANSWVSATLLHLNNNNYNDDDRINFFLSYADKVTKCIKHLNAQQKTDTPLLESVFKREIKMLEAEFNWASEEAELLIKHKISKVSKNVC